MTNGNINTYADLLNAPCFVVNMDKCQERLKLSIDRIKAAGFTNVKRFRATDATVDSLPDAWAAHGSPKFDPSDTEFVDYPGKQGCMLSHLFLWKHIIDNNVASAVVFEDDVCFHRDWERLAPKYFEYTPQDYDVLYMGSQMDIVTKGHITRVPVFCTHAYVITLEGATKLYNLLVHEPRGVRTIDCMLIDHMKAMMFDTTKLDAPMLFVWYVWNATMLPDPKAFQSADWAKRNSGLVFQDVDLGTYVRPW